MYRMWTMIAFPMVFYVVHGYIRGIYTSFFQFNPLLTIVTTTVMVTITKGKSDTRFSCMRRNLTNQVVLTALYLTSHLYNRKQFHFQLAPSHVGICCCYQADKLARPRDYTHMLVIVSETFYEVEREI